MCKFSIFAILMILTPCLCKSITALATLLFVCIFYFIPFDNAIHIINIIPESKTYVFCRIPMIKMHSNHKLPICCKTIFNVFIFHNQPTLTYYNVHKAKYPLVSNKYQIPDVRLFYIAPHSRPTNRYKGMQLFQ